MGWDCLWKDGWVMTALARARSKESGFLFRWRSFCFLGLEYSWLVLGSVGLAWLLGGEAVPRKED